MTCSDEAWRRETEMRMYLDTCRELQHRLHIHDLAGIHNYASELEALAERFDWPLLQARCLSTAAQARYTLDRRLYG